MPVDLDTLQARVDAATAESGAWTLQPDITEGIAGLWIGALDDGPEPGPEAALFLRDIRENVSALVAELRAAREAPPPPGPNEVKLLAEIARLHAQLAQCRATIQRVRPFLRHNHALIVHGAIFWEDLEDARASLRIYDHLAKETISDGC